MVELIHGKEFKYAAETMRINQKISGRVFPKIFYNFEEHLYEVSKAPFDFQLPIKSQKKKRHRYNSATDICAIYVQNKLELVCIVGLDLIHGNSFSGK